MSVAILIGAAAVLAQRAWQRRVNRKADEMFERDWRGPNQL